MVICFTKRLLDEKHNLSKIWLAAHWEKKIKRPQIFEVDIEKSVQDIMEAEIMLDLRISGHLLVGIVRIHSRKTKYLLTECSTIFYQVKIFHAGRIDLPNDKQTASVKDITLTEYLNDNFDNVGNDIVDALFSCNQSRLEDITLKETTEKLTLLDDDDMMNFEFHEEDEPFEFPGEDILSACNDLEVPKVSKLLVVQTKALAIYNQEANQNLDTTEEERLDELLNDFINKDPENLINEIPESLDLFCLMNEGTDQAASNNFETSDAHVINRRQDILELEPLNVSSRMCMRAKSRKRKLCIDYIKRLSEEDIKKQVLDTSDIISVFDMAPSSKRMMSLKEFGCAENLIRLPFLKLQNNKLLKIYERHLNTLPCDDFDTAPEEDENIIRPQTRRKRPRGESHEWPGVNGNIFYNLDDSSAQNIRSTSFSFDSDPIPIKNNFMDDGVTENCFESQDYETLLSGNLPSTGIQISSPNELQITPVSKTSEEKWECVLQERIINTLIDLKQLLETQSTVPFSKIAKNNRRLWVAQKFLCLLMLKKFEVVSLEQSGSYEEIFISRGLNFETACSKFYRA